ncbi:class I SAM-dependent methyltransferase [Agrobacterium rosae]
MKSVKGQSSEFAVAASQGSPVVECKICGANSQKFADAQVLKKHNTSLYSCEKCEFVFMDPIFWLDEAYANPITALDIGYVERNFSSAKYVENILRTVPENKFFVDYGGGTGLFVRLMRDKGFKFHIFEPYTETTFAKSCNADVDRFGKYEILTAIEVFEHLPNPVISLEEMLSFSRVILFTTELYPKPRPDFSKWWYGGLEHGQHVSFHSEKSLESLANKFNSVYRRLSSTWHVIAPLNHPLLENMPSWKEPKWQRRRRRLVARLTSVFSPHKPRRSLVQEDYHVMRDALSRDVLLDVHLDQSEGEK